MQKAYRIVTFLPLGGKYITAEEMVAKLNEKFDLSYGNYIDVAWYGQGTGQFRPTEGANPTQGVVGKLEKLDEVRLEFSVPHDAGLMAQVVEAMADLHPWEEPVIQVYEILETRNGN